MQLCCTSNVRKYNSNAQSVIAQELLLITVPCVLGGLVLTVNDVKSWLVLVSMNNTDMHDRKCAICD